MRINELNFSISKITAYLIALIIIYFHFTLPKYDYPDQTNEIAWDILSYYLYLPASFLHGDIGINDQAYIQAIFNKYHFSPFFYQAAQAPNGNWVMIYTSGMAILYMPFFLLGHLWAKIGGYPTDGFSYPYQFCVSSGMMIYILAGIFLLRKILLHFYTEKITTIVLVIIVLGTNYFREATDYNMGPHGILFMFYGILVLNTIRWHQNQATKYVIWMGISIGFLILIRPTEAICIFIPLLWGVYNRNSIKEKISLLILNKKHIILLTLTIFLVGLPQLIYWKYQTGSFLYNSYWNQNSFDITESHFLKVFFSFRKGWWLYTPLITLAFVGFLFMKNETLKKVRVPISIFIALNIFILTHVPVWHNAGSFGQRFMVQSYVILSLPMGAFFSVFSFKKSYLKVAIGLIASMLLFLNLFQTWQFVRWIIPADGMTWEYYKYSFFKTSYMTVEEQSMLMLQRTFDPNEKFNESNPNYQRRTIAFFNMDDVNSFEINKSYLDTTYSRSGKNSYVLSKENEFSLVYEKPYSHITQKDHLWIRITLWFFPTQKLDINPADIVIHLNHNGKAFQYTGFHLDSNPYKINEWNKYSVDYLTPYIQDEDDKIVTYLWFIGKQKIYIDDFQIEIFEKR
ncbi:MAG: hypothetical protein IPH89_00700 [Bacteroidetes bacterium]|nr:hypothetical protein [Bacteroidota bacterium]